MDSDIGTSLEIFSKNNIASPKLELVQSPLLEKHNIHFKVLRLDKIHPLINGNKWFKLKYNLQQARQTKAKTLLSFGGAYSNHIYALAAAGKQFGFNTIGLIRGELVEPLNPVLSFAKSQGMRLVPITRSVYRQKSTPDFIQQLRQAYGDFYLIPEGGSNDLALQGCGEIVKSLNWQSQNQPRYLTAACATGTTVAGLILGLAEHGQETSSPMPTVLGIAVLKADDYLHKQVLSHLQGRAATDAVPWAIETGFHGGGYAKCPKDLKRFLADFSKFSSIPLEPVYTGKLFQGLFKLIEAGKIADNSEIIALHTGGIHS